MEGWIISWSWYPLEGGTSPTLLFLPLCSLAFYFRVGNIQENGRKGRNVEEEESAG